VPDFDSLQRQLGYVFQQTQHLRLALTHPSLAHERGASVEHNQRLEFLGDAVLQLVLTDELYGRLPHLSEGDLTKARARLVNRHTLAAQGRQLGLGDFLLLSRGEEMTGGRQRVSTLADTFEAVVGAVYLDGGLEPVRRFIQNRFQQALDSLEVAPPMDNPKGELQERLQAEAAEPPHYRLESSSGPDHDRRFVSAVYHQGRQLGRGEGRSKKEAETAAAVAALAALQPPAPPPLQPK
jgi:ribonuclease-3